MLAAVKFPILSCAIVLTFAFCALNAVYADSATWSMNPTNGDWNNPANWTPHTVPNGPSDVAKFSTSTQTEISLSAPVTVAQITFNTDVSSYNITCAAGTSLTFTGFGIHRIAHHTRPAQSFTVAPAESSGGNPGALIFTGESAGTGVTMINNGGTAPGLAGGTTTFRDSSFPGEGTLIANGGTNGGGGGIVQFLDHAIGRRASVEINGNGGTLLIDTSSSVTELQSISGDGEVILNNTLRLGFPGMGGTFSGVISGSGGLMSAGSLTLTGANTYSGRTRVQGGNLIVNNTAGSATSSGDVLVRFGILGGDGIIAGDVTLDRGSQFSPPSLSPGTAVPPATDIGTLTLHKRLVFGLGAVYLCLVGGDTGESDLVVANSVSIDPTATLTLSENGTAPVGMTFTIIESTGSIPIVGTFMNLPDGGTITVGSNTFHADYEGGDGNDLTLTAVP
jgi:autotransporter-associated beta strand protein